MLTVDDTSKVDVRTMLTTALAFPCRRARIDQTVNGRKETGESGGGLEEVERGRKAKVCLVGGCSNAVNSSDEGHP